jgi:ABC-2 type transport system permease protein
MKSIWTIARRELQAYFNSLMAYIMLVAFLGFSGFFTWIYGSDVFMVNQASLQSFFAIAYWTLFFFIPALTMHLFAEENRSGTIELLLTKPIANWQVVSGKFLATLVLIIIALGFTFPYYLSVSNLGSIDHGSVITGYLGLILMSGAYISLGILFSSLVSNQIVAFLLTLFCGIFFQIIFGLLATATSGWLSSVFSYLDLSGHFESIIRGVVDSKDLVFFFSIIAFGFLITENILTRRNFE